MKRSSSPLSSLQRPARRAVAQPWVERLARLGYAAKGVVYFVVGLLAAEAALGVGGKTTDSSGALQEIVVQPFGQFLLAIVALGLLGYAFWRGVEAVLDPAHAGEPTDAKRGVSRVGYGLSAIAYAGLALTAAKLVLGTGTSNGNASQDWTARLLSQPLGQWLVGLAGVVGIGVGMYYLYQAFTAKFLQQFNLSQMSQGQRTWAKRLGQFGIAARSVVFAIIGLFLIQAARQSDASQAKGLGGALAVLAQQPFGPWLLGIVAFGLIAYSIYSMIEARYRQLGRSR